MFETIKKVNLKSLINLYLSDLPGPVDCLNMIQLKDESMYKIYGATLSPLLLLGGSKILWLATMKDNIYNEGSFNKSLIVRYSSHRRFLQMILNPYYWFTNLFREAGTAELELSFTQANIMQFNQEKNEFLLIRFDDSTTDIKRLAIDLHMKVNYHSKRLADIHIYDGDIPDNATNPIRFSNTMILDSYNTSSINQVEEKLKNEGIEFALSTWVKESLPEPINSLIG